MFAGQPSKVPQAYNTDNKLDEGLEVLEICCGCARLASHCSKVGLKALGVDWKGCKDKPEGRVIWIDLSTDRGVEELKAVLAANKRTLKVVFMSPPCGTASRAREIRRHKPDESGRIIDPKPFRSDEFPDGLPQVVRHLQRSELLMSFTPTWLRWHFGAMPMVSPGL